MLLNILKRTISSILPTILFFALISFSLSTLTATANSSQNNTLFQQRIVHSSFSLGKQLLSKQLKAWLLKPATNSQTDTILTHSPISYKHGLILPYTDLLSYQPAFRNSKTNKIAVELTYTLASHLTMISYLLHQLEDTMEKFKQQRFIPNFTTEQLLYSLHIYTNHPDVQNLPTVEQMKNKVANLQIHYNQQANLATLTFIGNFTHTNLFLNHELQTSTTFQLLPGEYHYQINRPQYLSMTGNVYLNPREQRTIVILLHKQPKKLLPITLKLSENLQPYKSRIVEIFKQLGFLISSNFDSLATISINWITEPSESHSISHSIKNFDSLNTNKHIQQLQIQLLDLNNQPLLTRQWSQRYFKNPNTTSITNTVNQAQQEQIKQEQTEQKQIKQEQTLKLLQHSIFNWSNEINRTLFTKHLTTLPHK